MPLSIPHQSYVGTDVYVGIDVHKKTYTIVAQVEQTLVKKWTMSASPAALTQQLTKYFTGGIIHTVYEAGFSGYVLHRALISQGIDSKVVHAAAVEVAAHDRVKTDKRDAKKLATQLESNRLKGIRVPSAAQEHRRLLSRTRSQLVKTRTRIKLQIRMKAHQFGLIDADDNREMTYRLVEALLANPVSSEFTVAITALVEVWKSLDVQIKGLEKQLQQQAKADPLEAIYRSVPAVGPISARVLANELGDMTQFSNERQLFSYTGLTPSEHSSGPSIQKGHITKQGNSYLRGILIELAWRALKKDPVLSQHYEQLSTRMGSKRAIVAVARKLIGRIRAVFRKGEDYQIGYLETRTAAR